MLSTLRDLATAEMRERAACGLVTGNVEGIARKKMRAVGVYATGALTLTLTLTNPPALALPYPSTHPNEGALAPAAAEQRWEGEEDASFLGGFGSDFCSGDLPHKITLTLTLTLTSGSPRSRLEI